MGAHVAGVAGERGEVARRQRVDDLRDVLGDARVKVGARGAWIEGGKAEKRVEKALYRRDARNRLVGSLRVVGQHAEVHEDGALALANALNRS